MLKRKYLSFFLSVLLIALLLPSLVFADAADAIEKLKDETFPFKDVSKSAWYYEDVKDAYFSHLINGKSATKFAPDDNMTAAEAVKLAACMHQLKKEGEVKLPLDGKPWYKPYVDYAKANDIIAGDLPWNEKINRAGYMQIFAQLITDDEASLNTIPADFIADVKATHPNFAAIMKLYQAGVLQGVDAAHNCKPASFIKRSEVAAILTRMMKVDKRLVFGGGVTDELQITKQPENFEGKENDPVTLRVEVKGGKAPLSYQWQFNALLGAEYLDCRGEGFNTNEYKAFVAVSELYYRCVITDADGKQVISDTATLIPKVSNEFRFVTQPGSVEGKVNDKVELKVEAKGGKQPYTYQWQYREYGEADFSNSVAEGNQTKVLRVPIDIFIYDYRCIVKDADGKEIVSDRARVSSEGVLSFVVAKQPEGFTGNIGDMAKLKVEVKGGIEPYTYEWQYIEFGKDKFFPSEAVGQGTDTLQVKVEDKIYGYRCVITDAIDFMSVVSDTIAVDKHSDHGDFKIVKQPQPVEGDVGQNAVLKVETEGGKAPLTYQWQYLSFGSVVFEDSVAVGNKTDTLVVPIEMIEYEYRCIITDADGKKLITKPVRVKIK